MKVKYLYVIVSLSFFLGLTSCKTTNDSDANKTVIEGHIRNPQGNKLFFYSFTDSASIYENKMDPIDSSDINADGEFKFSIAGTIAGTFDLKCGKKVLATNLFLIPGSLTKIRFDGDDQKPEIVSFGKESDYNRYLLQFADSFYADPQTKTEYYISTNYMSIQEFVRYSENRKRKQLEFFAGYFKGEELDSNFSSYALNTIHYGIAVDRLMYLWKKRMKSEKAEADSTYFSFITPEFLANKKAFNCPAYIRFLNLYVKDVYERSIDNSVLHNENVKSIVPSVEKYKIALELLDSPFCDAVIYNIILSDMNDVGSREVIDPKMRTNLDSMKLWFVKKYSL